VSKEIGGVTSSHLLYFINSGVLLPRLSRDGAVGIGSALRAGRPRGRS
jgi:hypothetical protein